MLECTYKSTFYVNLCNKFVLHMNVKLIFKEFSFTLHYNTIHECNKDNFSNKKKVFIIGRDIL